MNIVRKEAVEPGECIGNYDGRVKECKVCTIKDKCIKEKNESKKENSEER